MEINQKIIKRFTSSKFSFNDYLSVSAYFNSEQHSNELKKDLENDWNTTDNSDADTKHLGQLLDSLHHQIHLDQENKVITLKTFYSIFSKIAVVLLIPALITIAVLFQLRNNPSQNNESWAEIHSPIGSRTKFQLPDGSTGWLNNGSSIKYPVNFSQNRNVEISGEAWFDVVHLNSQEFKVITPYFNVKVLGTKFNVIAYDDAATAEVILESGKVLVLDKNDRVKNEMEPDQQIIFNKSTQQFSKKIIDSKNYTSWKDGWLIFRNVPMSEIAKRLERRYNIEIILHGDELEKSIFRATFQDESLEEICDMLAIVAPINYKIHERKITANNTFEKRKVEIWLKKI